VSIVQLVRDSQVKLFLRVFYFPSPKEKLKALMEMTVSVSLVMNLMAPNLNTSLYSTVNIRMRLDVASKIGGKLGMIIIAKFP